MNVLDVIGGTWSTGGHFTHVGGSFYTKPGGYDFDCAVCGDRFYGGFEYFESGEKKSFTNDTVTDYWDYYENYYDVENAIWRDCWSQVCDCKIDENPS